MASINLSSMDAILPPALANAALLIAAPSIGCINTYIRSLTNLCRAYCFPVPDFTHVFQCKDQTNLYQKKNIGTMVNDLDLNVVPSDVKNEHGDTEFGNYVQDMTCISCDKPHSEANYVCPVKQELFEECTAMYVACRSAAKRPGSPMKDMSITKTKLSHSQDQAQHNKTDNLQKIPVTVVAQAKISSYDQESTIQPIASITTQLDNIVTGASLTSPESFKKQQKKTPQQIFDNSRKSLYNGEHQIHHSDHFLDNSYKSQSSDEEYQTHPVHNIYDSKESQSDDEGHQKIPELNFFDNSNSHCNDKEHQRSPAHNVFNINKSPSTHNVLDNRNLQLTTVQSSYNIVDNSKSQSNDKEHQNHQVHDIFDISLSQFNKEEHKEFPTHIICDNGKSQSHNEEDQKFPLHNIFDINKSQSHNEKHQNLSAHTTFDNSSSKSNDIENNNSDKFQSIDKDKSPYSHEDKSQSSNRDNSKPGKEKVLITLKEIERTPVYHILDNTGKSHSTYSKGKTRTLLFHSMPITYSNSIIKPSKCKVYVSTIKNGTTRIPWLHLEYNSYSLVSPRVHKGQKHIPFSKIYQIAIWKNNSIRISYSSSKNELTINHFFCLHVTKQRIKNNKRETDVEFSFTTLKWLRSFFD